MTITYQPYDTSTLLGVMREFEPPTTYFLDLLFNSSINFTDEFVDFGKISETRKIAPLVVPMAQGKPVYTEAARAMRVKPAYVKPKDAVSPSRLFRKRPGEVVSQSGNASPAQRRDAIVSDIMREHNNAIWRRWEWMAAEAALYGKVTLEDEGYPETVVDFERAAGHTITLAPGARWGEVGISIITNLETWRSTVRRASFGGPVTRLTVGTGAWDIMRKDDEIKAMLDINTRGSNANLNLNMRNGEEVEYVGDIAPGMPVFVYSGYYQNSAGAAVDFMDPRDVLLSGPNFQGVRAYGAILDSRAGFQALEMFPKTWEEQDPSVEFVMTQSAPLMVPTNPNCTLRARVIA